MSSTHNQNRRQKRKIGAATPVHSSKSYRSNHLPSHRKITMSGRGRARGQGGRNYGGRGKKDRTWNSRMRRHQQINCQSAILRHLLIHFDSFFVDEYKMVDVAVAGEEVGVNIAGYCGLR